MSITAYVGLPGSGKTYSAIENVLIPAIKSKRVVATNIPLNQDVISNDYPDSQIHIIKPLTEQEYPQEWEKIPPGAVVILDEVWRFWPAGLKANDASSSCKAFLAEHRHIVSQDGFSTEIYLIVQDLSNISTFARLLVENTFLTTKLSEIGASKKYRVDIYPGSVKGPKYPETKIRTLYGTYKPDIYKYYRSHTKSIDGIAGNEQKTDDRVTIWKNYIFLIGIPSAIVLIIFGTISLYRFFTAKSVNIPENQPVHEQQIIQPEIKPEPIKTIPKTKPIIQDSSTWRLVGYIKTPDKEYYLIHDNNGNSRKIDSSYCQDIFIETRCTVNNEIITRYTGQATLKNLASNNNQTISTLVNPALGEPANQEQD